MVISDYKELKSGEILKIIDFKDDGLVVETKNSQIFEVPEKIIVSSLKIKKEIKVENITKAIVTVQKKFKKRFYRKSMKYLTYF